MHFSRNPSGPKASRIEGFAGSANLLFDGVFLRAEARRPVVFDRHIFSLDGFRSAL